MSKYVYNLSPNEFDFYYFFFIFFIFSNFIFISQNVLHGFKNEIFIEKSDMATWWRNAEILNKLYAFFKYYFDILFDKICNEILPQITLTPFFSLPVFRYIIPATGFHIIFRSEIL